MKENKDTTKLVYSIIFLVLLGVGLVALRLSTGDEAPDEPLGSAPEAQDVTLPKDFPRDIPIYEGKIVKAFTTRYVQDNKHRFDVSYLTATPIQAVRDGYIQYAQTKGWSVEEHNVVPTAFSLRAGAETGDVELSIEALSESETRVDLSYLE